MRLGNYGVSEVEYETVDRVLAEVERDEGDRWRGWEVVEILEYALSFFPALNFRFVVLILDCFTRV